MVGHAKTEIIKTRVSRPLKRRLGRVAKCKKVNPSKAMREAIVEYVERNDPLAA